MYLLYGLQVMFPAGSVPGNEVFFSTVVFDDSIVGNDRLITTTLTVMPPGVFTSGGNVTNTTLMVIDNDGTYIYIYVCDY